MDIATTLGLMAGAGVLATLILMGGDLRMFMDAHAFIVIFGGSFSATLIRFPLSSIFHGLPLGARYAFTLRRTTQRELVDEIAGLAELARKQGPIGLEKVEIDDTFLAKGVRFIADGYDADFIRDNLERDRDIFLTHLDEGQKIYRAVGDCAPAFGMIGTLIGMVQMFANMTDPSKLGPYMAVALLATSTNGGSTNTTLNRPVGRESRNAMTLAGMTRPRSAKRVVSRLRRSALSASALRSTNVADLAPRRLLAVGE